MLHITNGEAASARLQSIEIPGDFLAWDDPLHHGPAPAGLSMREMSEIRAGFIAECGWESLEHAKQHFRDRDLKLRVAAQTGQVVIWSSFELFDQLHLMQILAWFEQHRDVYKPPQVVWVWDYLGSGDTDDDELRNLFLERDTISAPQQGTAADLWQAFCAPNPDALLAWRQRTLRDLPFMQRALIRLLEEYPWVRSGLSRTQQQAMQVLQPGPLPGAELFQTAQALEQRRFMGDWSFWLEFAGLFNAEEPAVQTVSGKPPIFPPAVDGQSEVFQAQTFELTDAGRSILAQRQSLVPLGERWIGGVRIDAACRYRWDPAAGIVVAIEPD